MNKFTNTNNVTNPSDSLSANTLKSYNRNLLRRVVENTIASKFTMKKTQPKYEGKKAVFSIYDNIDDTAFSGAILADGVTPAGVDMTKTSVEVDIVNRGAFTSFTDEVSLYHEDGKILIKEATSNLGDAAGQAIEKAIFAEMIAGAGIDQVATPPASTEAGLDTVIVTLRKNLGRTFKSYIFGSKNTDTKTIKEAYIGFVHPDDSANLEAINGFVGCEKYGYDGLLPNELGSYKKIRFCESTNVTPGAVIVIAEESVGEVSVRGNGKMQTIVNGLGSEGSADPLSQRQSVGTKYQHAVKVLRPEWVAKSAVV